MASAIRVGSRVRVELHGRRVGAWVVEEDVSPTAGVSPKPLAASSGKGPPPSLVAVAEWAAWRWAGPLSSFLGTASPPRVVKENRSGPDDGGAVGDGTSQRPASPGGGSVTMVDAVLADPTTPSVVRLAPALDALLVVLELLHRLGTAGVLLLAPSHARSEQLAARLRAGGIPVALMPDGWEEASLGGSVVIGTRAAAWAPIPRIAAAIVLDAHDEAYREERSPTWSAVDVVVERGRRDSAPVVLVSPCPPLVLTEGANLVTTARAVERRGWPVVEAVDRTGDDPRTGLFSERLVRVVRSALDRPGAMAVCILNRTGRIRLLACAACGALARCTRCGGAVDQREAAGALRCRRCGDARPASCEACDSARLKALRIGVTRATEELSALLGVDASEVTGGRDRRDAPEARLIVGTEAALHRVARADVVAFLDIDQHLLAPRFGAGEEALALVARAARLVGSRDGGGRVVVQTRIPDHEVLAAAVHGDPSLLAVSERPLRRSLDLPPFGALALLRGPGAPEFADGLRAVAGLEVSSLGTDRWLVRASDHRRMCDGLTSVTRPAGRLRVEVDPTDV